MYLSILCNSTVIEIYGNKIQVPHSFKGCQMLEYNVICNITDNRFDYLSGFKIIAFFDVIFAFQFVDSLKYIIFHGIPEGSPFNFFLISDPII